MLTIASFIICLIFLGIFLFVKFGVFTIAKRAFSEDKYRIFRHNYESSLSWDLARGASAGLMLVFLVISAAFGLGAIIERAEENIYYETSITVQKTLQNIVDNTTDIINQDVYFEIIEFNKSVATKKIAQNHPLYFLSYSGDYDWSAVPLVTVLEK